MCVETMKLNKQTIMKYDVKFELPIIYCYKFIKLQFNNHNSIRLLQILSLIKPTTAIEFKPKFSFHTISSANSK